MSPALLILLGRSALAQEGDAAPEVTSGETIEPAEAAPVAEEPVAAPPRPPRAPDEPNTVTIHHDADGYTLLVDGEVTMVRGMNWGYMPIGQNYSYDFWGQPDDFIEAALRTEMGLLAAMGVNSIRQYPVIPPRWVRWIYDNYGITTMINPLVGRYGTTMAGRWIPVVDYSDPATRAHLKAETLAAVELYRDTPGVLLWLLGNENNYGLHWSSFEIEALPEDARDDARAVHLYSLYGEIIDAIHARDDRHPVSIANGDLQYIDVLAEHAGNLDIMGSNVYRGISSRDLFAEVEEKLGVPFLYTEFGADAYNARRGAEDHLTQARYLVGQWGEIYRKSAGKGEEGNAIGGYTFQWSDGWWKYLQETELDVHNTNASWPNAGYAEDYVEGANNMNEEWFGICAKGPPDASGLYEVYPRAAYYARPPPSRSSISTSARSSRSPGTPPTGPAPPRAPRRCSSARGCPTCGWTCGPPRRTPTPTSSSPSPTPSRSMWTSPSSPPTGSAARSPSTPWPMSETTASTPSSMRAGAGAPMTPSTRRCWSGCGCIGRG